MKNDYSIPKDLYFALEVDADALIKAKAEAYTRAVELRAHRDDKTVYKQDRLRVEYHPPNVGWLQAKIYINDEKILDFHFSDYNWPLTSLISWMEEIIDYRHRGTAIYCQDLEGDSAVFIQDVIGRNEKEISLFVALNSWYAKEVTEFPHGSAILCTEDIVLAFYRPLIRMFEDLAFERYHDGIWFHESCKNDEVSPLALLEDLHSEKIEQYLKEKHVWP